MFQLSDVVCPPVDLRADGVNLESVASLYDEAVDESIDRHRSYKSVEQKIGVLEK